MGPKGKHQKDEKEFSQSEISKEVIGLQEKLYETRRLKCLSNGSTSMIPCLMLLGIFAKYFAFVFSFIHQVLFSFVAVSMLPIKLSSCVSANIMLR